MQTKSEMINPIAELAKENAELKGTIDAYQMSENEANEIIAELKAENDRLKRENGIITGMCNSSSNRFDKLYNCLQEIKTIAEENKDTAQYGGICKSILMIITKAEEE